ncbi:MAG: hypothetical protein GXP14_16430 [Gammaproteobacteria bacterium]|nr:hypothetical protein [Gammaproteobacteria bacterium]
MARSTTSFIKRSAEEGLPLNIKHSKDIPLPPSISADTFNSQGGFDPDTVVSRHYDGSVASRFKDPYWDFSALAGAHARYDKIHYPDDEKLANEVKTILKLVMITPTSHQPEFGRFRTFGSLLKRLADFCMDQKTTLIKLFNTKGGIGLAKLIKEDMPFYAQLTITISDYLYFLREKVGFEHGYKPLSNNVQARLRKVFQDYQGDRNQNPVIPGRIFKAVLDDTISAYEALLPVLDQLMAMQSEIDSHPMVGRNLCHQKDLCKKLCGTSFSQLKATYPANYDLAHKYPLARDFLNLKFNKGKAKSKDNGFDFDVLYDRSSVLEAINYIQRVCHDIIIMFTGMRPAEAELLPYFGSKETIVDGVKYWLIYGFAIKKRMSIPPFEMWVTNEYGYKVFQTAKLIADLYYTRNQRQPIKSIPDEELTPDMSPLFLRDNNEIVKQYATLKKTPCKANAYIITKADFDELKMIDPHRVWEKSPEFAVGKPFPVRLALFRRTIAFFASASGVRLVDQKNQLHHLFDSQTLYYGQGSGRANPFLQNKDSFASYFNQVKHEAEAFMFISKVIDFDGKLFGASATYAERNQAFYNTIREHDRSKTIKAFQRGELAYKETHLGGCMTTRPCKYKALGSVTACLDCKDAVIRPDKIAHAINDQAHFVDSLNPQRLEFRTEIQELVKMLEYAIKYIGNAMKDIDRRTNEYKQFSQWFKEFKRMKLHYLKKIKEL